MAKHKFGPYSKKSKGKGHPIMFGDPKPALFSAVQYNDFPEGGGYPKGFLEWAFAVMGVTDESKVLHLCSGSVLTGVRVDVRPEKNPDYVADCRNVPIGDESFDWILSDPPYSPEWAKNLYGTESKYPEPFEIVKEATRLLRPGGLFGIMHFQVPYIRKPMEMVGVWGITQGLGYNIRAWTLLRKQHNGVFSGTPSGVSAGKQG